MSFETLRYEVDGGVARLTLNRPEQMNGMTNRMVREARDALELAAADTSLRVLVLTGAGRAFCPGADLNHFTSGGADEVLTALEVDGSWALEDALTGERYEGEGVVRVPMPAQSVRMLRVASVRTPRAIGARSDAPAKRGATA